jgi:hypothetical protein
VAVDESLPAPAPDLAEPSQGRPLIASLSGIGRTGRVLQLTVDARPNSRGTTYQWQVRKTEKKGNEKEDWTNIADGLEPDSAKDPDPLAEYFGAAKPTLTIANVTGGMKAYRYRCVVTGPQILPVVLKNDPRDPKYPLFLALAYELRQAQIRHLIPAPYKSVATANLEAQDRKDAEEDAVTVSKPKLADVVSAEAAGYKVDSATGQANAYSVYKDPSVTDTTFALQFPDDSLLADYPVLHWIISHHDQIRCSMRSFDACLYEIAKEEQRFDQVLALGAGPDPVEPRYTISDRAIALALGPLVPKVPAAHPETAIPAPVVHPSEAPGYWNRGDRYLGVTITIGSESFAARPILRVTNYQPGNALARVPHLLEGKTVEYVVGDFPLTEESDDATPSVKNLTEFTMLAYLFNQASIDSTKLPVQQLFQVR